MTYMQKHERTVIIAALMTAHLHGVPVANEILEFQVRYDLDPGLGDYRDSLDWFDVFPATVAGLARARDETEIQATRQRGSYGSASAHLEARTVGGGAFRVDDNDVFDLPNGIITPADCRPSVEWNGQNLVAVERRHGRALYGNRVRARVAI